MPLNKLDNFIKNTEGRILYVSPADLDATDSIGNTGNSLARPFKTIQRALIESARFSYIKGNNNDETEKTTILLMPGEHEIDNRPGYFIFQSGSEARVTSPDGTVNNENASNYLPLTLNSNFDLNQSDNDLVKFNSINGGVIVPRGTSIVGLDLRKTKIRPKYVPNPTDNTPNSAIFRITGACYLWQFSIFDGNEFDTVYTQYDSSTIKSSPTFSHHKLTCFEYADGVNNVISNSVDLNLTDLEMYYAKLSIGYGTGSGNPARDIDDKFPSDPEGFAPQRPEFEIVGAFGSDSLTITDIESGSGGVPSNLITVTTELPHELNAGTPIRITGVSDNAYNISTKVVEVDDTNNNVFYYNILSDPSFITPQPSISGNERVTIETDTVSGASPYIFNISLRSVWGMNGMHGDGSKATGFRSMVVAQFTGVSLQKDDRAFVKYSPSNRDYSDNIEITPTFGADLSAESSSSGTAYHLDSQAIYRRGWDNTHIKVTNDAIMQIVSVFAIGYNNHFLVDTGGDASITNSNSNFGQLSLVSKGFKKEAFEKDNKAYLTHIIPPRAITSEEEDIDWLRIDIDKTLSVANNTRLYIDGFENESIKPPILSQGYRIGAAVNDKLFLDIDGTIRSANILMSNASGSSSFRKVSVSQPSSNIFTANGHGFTNREKVIIISDDGDYPENLDTNTVYYVIFVDANRFKLAGSEPEAENGEEITVYKGTNLSVISRVSDKESGDVAHPVQYDGDQWYINTDANSEIYQNLTSGISEPTFVRRIEDNRSLDEKIYKLRVVVPRQFTNGKTPEAGFIIQESSSTGAVDASEFTDTTITRDDVEFKRNPRFISTCSRSSSTVTVITELPHNLNVGDSVLIKNVTDSTINTGVGTFNKGYNGTYTVSTIDDDLTFKYTTTQTPGSFTNDTSVRDTDLPRFERNNLQSNLYVYRNEIINEYDDGQQSGVYHIYGLKSDEAIETEFTNLEYSQNVVNLYPQLDRDNEDDNPLSANSYAKRSPIGEVVTNDLKKSITRESVDSLITNFGIGLDISSVSNSATSADITFTRRHGFAGIVTGNYSALTANFTPGTYQNTKIFNNSGLTQWNGATATIVVAGGGNISNVTIVSNGSGYSAGTYYLDENIIGNGNNNQFTITSSGISSSIGDVIQFTGAGKPDTYHRITAVGSDTQISIAKTSGDPTIDNSQYAILISPSAEIDTNTYTSDISTITTISPHSLSAGNRFRIIDSNNNNQGDFIIEEVIGINTFTYKSTNDLGALSNGYILKHGLSANKGISDSSNENLDSRSLYFYDKETLTLNESVTSSDTSFKVSSAGIGTALRFPLGSYIQVGREIMRVSSSSLGGINDDEISVIRGVLSTKADSYANGELLKKVNIPAIEFRRPSIIRASGHTFEYLGYGPGNYSTALPQVQDITLTEREEFLTQSQERSGGIVVYTGMNNKGDFFIGNQKKSSATGEEITFDTPIPTITGEDPSRLSAVFDEVTIKERLVVEGGSSNQVLSQFEGPVNFSSEVRFSDNVRIVETEDSTSSTSGALIVSGGVGIGKTLNVEGKANIGNIGIDTNTISSTNTNGDINIDPIGTGEVNISSNTSITGILNIDNVRIDGNTIDVTNTNGDLNLSGNGSGSVNVTSDLDITGSLNVTSDLDITGNLGIGGSATIGNDRDTDTHTVNGSFTINGRGSGFVVMGQDTNGGSIEILRSSGSFIDLKRSENEDYNVRLDNFTSRELKISAEGSNTAELKVTGDITAFASDERLKTDIKPIENALTKTLSLNGFTYKFNEIGEKLGFNSNITYSGVSAQEVQKVLPEVVKPAPVDENYITVQYDKVIPLLIEAIKELSNKVERLERQLEDK